jgi:iron-sulfur cluster repair protein YtfE (RIC family)
MPPFPSVYETFYRSLLQVHRELLEGAQRIADAAGDGARDAETEALVLELCDTLLRHHKAEDAFFFPAFRAAGRLKSSDVAVLAALDDEHVTVHRVCLEMQQATEARRRGVMAAATWRQLIGRHALELTAACVPHFAEEERLLTADHLATMVTPDQFLDVYRDMKQNWTRR